MGKRHRIRWLTGAVVFAGMLTATFSGVARAAAPANHAWPGRNGDLVLEAYAPGNSNTPSILMVHPDGTGLRTVFGDGLQTRRAWDISPDGTEIAGGSPFDPCVGIETVTFATHAWLGFDAPAQDGGLFMCNNQDRDAAYSYDGTQIAWATVGPSASAGLWVAESDGSNKRLLYAAPDVAYIRWSTDSKMVSWVSDAARFQIPSDGSSQVQATGPGEFDEQPGRPSEWAGGDGTDSPPILSPDGNKITYLHCCFPDTADVAQPMIANLDGSDAHRVVPLGLAGDCSLSGCGDTSRGNVYQLLWQTVQGNPDTTAPTVTITQPAEGKSFNLGSIVGGIYSCQDDAGGSGIASCIGAVPDHNVLDTSTLGHHTFTVQAIDRAGNVTTVTHTYEIIPPGLALYRADLAVIKAELTSMRSGLRSFWSRYWLDKAVESADWAAADNCWTANGRLATTEAGYGCLQALRIVALRLNYADRDLRMASAPQRDELVDLIDRIAQDRLGLFIQVQNIDAWRASGPTAPLWSARRDVMNAGDNPHRIEASIGYIRAWHRLMNLVPQP
jgi:hypothetical protein